MILVIALNEILGNYIRMYYSLLTGRKIDFITPENNNDELTGKEYQFFIESNFLGINPWISNIGLKKCLSLFYSPNLNDYPIFKKDGFSINIDAIKTIYKDNKFLFNFMMNEEKDKSDSENVEYEDEDENEEDNDENEEDSEVDKYEDISTTGIILLEDYLDILINMNDTSYSFRHSHHDELYFIHFDKFNDYTIEY